MSYRILLIFCILALAGTVFANSATQSNWAGGPGEPGPVTPWGTMFNTSMSIDYDTSPGLLTLSLPYGEHLIDYMTVDPNALVFADLNDDAREDIACVAEDGIWWWENVDGIGFAWVRHSISSTSSFRGWISADDFDNDGDIDLCASLQNDGLYWWENEGGAASWDETEIYDGQVRGSCVADIDDDGWDDIVLAVHDTADIMWWRNKLGSSHTWTPNYIDGAFTGAYTVDAMDMNGSGRPDVAAGSATNGQVAIWINNGASWDKDVLVPSSYQVRDVSIADLDNNGSYDVLAATAGAVGWWKNINWTHWEYYDISTDLGNPISVATADLNDDGYQDVLGLSYGWGGEVYWFENNGSGASWTLMDTFASMTSYDVAVGDLNDDGIPEFATPSREYDTVQYFRVGGYDTPGEIVSSIYDTGAIDDINWDYLHWDSAEPGGTDLHVAIRGSSDSGLMGVWSDWLSGPTSLDGMLEDTDRYIQYKVFFETDNPWVAPILYDITFLWSVTGISGDPTFEEPLVLNGANPVHGSFQLGFHLPVAGHANIRVYDMAGREAIVPVDGWMNAGAHSTTVSGLPSGIYVCTYSAPQVSSQLQIVVVN